MRKEEKTKGLKAFEVDEKTRAQEKNRPRFTWHLFRNIYRGVKIPWGRYIFAALIGLIFYIISGSNAGVTAKIASGDFSNTGDIVKYVVISILALGTAFAGVALDFANFRLGARVRSKLWRKILRLPTEYFDKESPNRIISRITVDTDAALVPFSLVTIVLVLLGLGLGVLLSSLTVIGTPMMKWLYAGIIVMIVLTIITLIMMAFVGFIVANRLSVFTAYLSERLSNFKLIKAAQSEQEELAKAHQLIDNRYKADMLGVVALVLNTLSASVLLMFGYIGGFLVGWSYYEQGLVGSGQTFVQFNALAAGLSALVTLLGVVISGFGTGAGQATTFASIFDEKEEKLDGGEPIPEEPKDILLRNVSFAYDESHKALKDISCRIKKGEVTALVGANGSGKSTLVKVLDRLYTDVDGDIFFGEHEADGINLASWRERIGIVSQNAGLFSGSIRSNICYGIENVTEEELAAVCKMSGLEEVLAAHEEGLDYEVGISGCKLSGGEQQRVAIARAMMKNPDYLILDEATANLDSKTAKAVQESIDTLMAGRTVITIAHNYETIKKADKIIVLTDGEVAADGTHKELMETSEFYQQLCAAGFEV